MIKFGGEYSQFHKCTSFPIIKWSFVNANVKTRFDVSAIVISSPISSSPVHIQHSNQLSQHIMESNSRNNNQRALLMMMSKSDFIQSMNQHMNEHIVATNYSVSGVRPALPQNLQNLFVKLFPHRKRTPDRTKSIKRPTP